MEPGEAVPSDADMLYRYTLATEDCDDFESSAVRLYEIRRLIDSIASKEDALLWGNADAANERYVLAVCGVFYALCGVVCYVLCVMYCVLCAMCNVLCVVLCDMLCAMCYAIVRV